MDFPSLSKAYNIRAHLTFPRFCALDTRHLCAAGEEEEEEKEEEGKIRRRLLRLEEEGKRRRSISPLFLTCANE